MKPITWTIKNIIEILVGRQENEFDGNIAVSGQRGDGKSTLIYKIFCRFKGFNPWKHMVYNRPDIMHLLKSQEYGLCWDDEAINSGYKRNFQEKAQQELIKILTAYRDNYNIYASAIPNFFSLDKDLRDLYFIHLHVIERGVAVIHMPLQGRLYSQDRWDAKYNAKIEDSWSKKMHKDPNFKPPYHRLSTFRGYLFFSDVTAKQKKLYKTIKKEKRQKAFLTDEEKIKNNEITFVDKLYKTLMDGKLTSEGLMQACFVQGEKHSSINTTLNRMLKDSGEQKTVRDFFVRSRSERFHSKVQDEITQSFDQI